MTELREAEDEHQAKSCKTKPAFPAGAQQTPEGSERQ